MTMQLQGRILLVTYKGTLNASLMHFFSDNLEEALSDIKGSPWGYLSHSNEASVATKDVEALLMESGLNGLQWGCVGAAYLIKSPVLMAQTSKVRKAMGIEQPLEDVLFDTLEEARAYLQQIFESALQKT